MQCLDVNILVNAHRADLADHDAYRAVLDDLANGSEPLGVPDICLSGFLRIVTNRHIFAAPTPRLDAVSDVEALLTAPATLLLVAGHTHWATFMALTSEIEARGDDIPDAFIAAYAVDNNATLLSSDRGFARFESLRWRHPLAA